MVLAEEALIFSPQEGERLKIGPLIFEVFWPEERLGDLLVWQLEESQEKILGAASVVGNPNETSVVLKLSFGNFDTLLTGDIGFILVKKSWI